MKRLACLGVLAALACGEEEKPPPPPPPSGLPAQVRISGRAAVHPDAAAWLSLAGEAAPTLAGASITVEEALRATTGQPALNTGTVDASSNFDFPVVDATKVSLALFSRLDDPSGASDAIMPTGTGLVRGRPPADIADKIVYGMPRSFVRALNDAVTDIDGVLESEGFILGKVVDAQGNPIAGAKLHMFTTGSAHVEQTGVFYVNAITGTTVTAIENGSTSANGLFIFRPAPGVIGEFTASRGSDTFDKHLAGANEGTAFCLFVTKTN